MLLNLLSFLWAILMTRIIFALLIQHAANIRIFRINTTLDAQITKRANSWPIYHVGTTTLLLLLFQSSVNLEPNTAQGAISFSRVRQVSNMPLYLILGQWHFFIPSTHIQHHPYNISLVKTGWPIIIYCLMYKNPAITCGYKKLLHLLMNFKKNY